MNKYIKLDDAIGITTEHQGIRGDTFKALHNAYAVDIVRCGECKHCSLDVCVERTVSGKERCINICNRHSAEWVVDKDWFCADGERKE